MPKFPHSSWTILSLTMVLALALFMVSGQPSKSRQVSSTKKPAGPPNNSPTRQLQQPTQANLTFALSGRNIPTTDHGSEVDAFVTLYSKDGSSAVEKEWAKTTVVNNDDQPVWNQVYWFLWKKGTGQKWRFVVKDHDTLGRKDFIGQVTVDVDQFVLEKNQDLTLPLEPESSSSSSSHPPVGRGVTPTVVNPKAKGKVMKGAKVSGGFLMIKKTEKTSFRLYARNVPKKDPLNGKSDPYVECYWRKGKNGTNVVMGKTSVKDDEENPDWNETIDFLNWQKGTDQHWYFKVLDKDNLSSDLVGELVVPVDDFVLNRRTKISKLTNSDGKATLAITPV